MAEIEKDKAKIENTPKEPVSEQINVSKEQNINSGVKLSPLRYEANIDNQEETTKDIENKEHNNMEPENHPIP